MNTDSNLSVVIVDDERSARSTLRHLLADYCPNVAVLGEAASASEGSAMIESTSPDLIFLDIRMPFGSGFEMLENMRSRDFQVVFTTAYEEYAIKAFRFSAFDYLLKPIDIGQIREVVARAIRSRLSSRYHSQRLEVLLDNEAAQTRTKMVLTSLQGFRVVEIAEIVRCHADRNYTEIYFREGPRYVASKSLKDYQYMLEEHGFFRVHQSHLINLREVAEFSKVGRGGTVLLKDGTEVEVARRKRREFVERMHRMIDSIRGRD